MEREPRRVERLRPLLEKLLPQPATGDSPSQVDDQGTERLRAAGYASDAKPHVFVAMPFKSEMDDTYRYGIQGVIRDAGFVCERTDLSSFVGDVMDWVQNRIETSSFLIADLTDANPNVYLEVGYAWGCGKPVVLLVESADHLQFDVRGQKCLVYKSIREVEELLSKELTNLLHTGEGFQGASSQRKALSDIGTPMSSAPFLSAIHHVRTCRCSILRHMARR